MTYPLVTQARKEQIRAETKIVAKRIIRREMELIAEGRSREAVEFEVLWYATHEMVLGIVAADILVSPSSGSSPPSFPITPGSELGKARQPTKGAIDVARKHL